MRRVGWALLIAVTFFLGVVVSSPGEDQLFDSSSIPAHELSPEEMDKLVGKIREYARKKGAVEFPKDATFKEQWSHYQALPAGVRRTEFLRRMTLPHARYLRTTKDTSYVPKLEAIANSRTASPKEHESAVICLHRSRIPSVVDALIRLTKSEFAETRFYATEGLGFVRGEAAPSAVSALRELLKSKDGVVRGEAAASLARHRRDPKALPAKEILLPEMVAALTTADSANEAERIARAIVKLWQAEGRAAVTAVRAKLTGSIRDAVDRVLKNGG